MLMQKKKKKEREEVINKKRHPSIWTDTSEWGKMGRRNRVFTSMVADKFSNFWLFVPFLCSNCSIT